MGKGTRPTNSPPPHEAAVPVITGITEHPRKPGRFLVEFEDGDPALVSLDTIEALQLQVGTPLDAAQRARLAHAAGAQRTFDRALGMLAAQPRSAADLRRRLERAGEDRALVEDAIQRLTDKGLLDDGDFARQYARSAMVGKGVSSRRARQELARRGVATELADAAITDLRAEEEVDETSNALRAGRRKLRALASVDPGTHRRRLYAFLARRGYEADDIRAALRTLLDDRSGSED